METYGPQLAVPDYGLVRLANGRLRHLLLQDEVDVPGRYLGFLSDACRSVNGFTGDLQIITRQTNIMIRLIQRITTRGRQTLRIPVLIPIRVLAFDPDCDWFSARVLWSATALRSSLE